MKSLTTYLTESQRGIGASYDNWMFEYGKNCCVEIVDKQGIPLRFNDKWTKFINSAIRTSKGDPTSKQFAETIFAWIEDASFIEYREVISKQETKLLGVWEREHMELGYQE